VENNHKKGNESMAIDPIAIASAVFGGISALSDVIGLYRSYRARGEDLPVAEVDKAMQEAEAAAKAKPSTVQRLKKVIDDDDLEVIRGNIDKAKKRLRKSLADPANDNEAKDNAIDIANSTICAELKRIKKLNGGKLPGHEYENWWNSHGCAA
jgi:hypothetical protein